MHAYSLTHVQAFAHAHASPLLPSPCARTLEVEQQVLGLDVAVDHVLLVTVLERTRKLLNVLQFAGKVARNIAGEISDHYTNSCFHHTHSYSFRGSRCGTGCHTAPSPRQSHMVANSACLHAERQTAASE
eukprot:6176340-Pleurochrysis_carterae.AAC.4